MEIVNKQRAYFETGATLPVATRISYLRKLYKTIQTYESEIAQALYEDLGKSHYEGYMCEIGLCLSELSYIIKHTEKWAKPQKVKTDLAQFHAKSFKVKNPLGVVLIMSPWNYPFMLTMEPLFGAISAGNCCVVKPSAYSPNTSLVIKKIIEEVFPEEYVAVISGGRKENEALLNTKFDYIFFTGSVSVGKTVMEKAAKYMTPFTLELGGKSPCIVDETANVKVAAKRIVFGKLLNCGQTCVAPDYILVHKQVKDTFVSALQLEITKTYGKKPLKNPNFGKIINQKHFERLLGLIDEKKVIFGGKSDADALKIEPTILNNVSLDDAVMQEEIFGPILPVITFDTFREAENIIKSFEHPLAAYLFSNDVKRQKYFMHHMIFGGGCINDCIVHLATSRMPFGGVGASGMGKYHGKYSFDTFSHEKGMLKRYNWMDLPMRYQPYQKYGMYLLKLFLK
ncbi:aldehyde dehydrogenase [Chakrabartyella piscis]|uniref:aldehyde dehydrogenase n=1 Tax=Chakrabartyella piscis TaxID=2918914 RepID=UPI002958C6FB|nr:aldehyde dehydrogenase [Chakrabartyella piscis]